MRKRTRKCESAQTGTTRASSSGVSHSSAFSCQHIAVVQSLSHIWHFATPWIAAFQASLSFTICWSLSKLKSIELVMPSNHLILCNPFLLCLQSFPASGSFPVSWLFTSSGQSTGASPSVFPMKEKLSGTQPHHFTAKKAEEWKQWQILFSWVPKSLQTVTAAMKWTCHK